MISAFVQQHASDTSSAQAHTTAAFLPWHRYFLWEFESAFRTELGSDYECFSLPYWYSIYLYIFIFMFVLNEYIYIY